VQDVCRDLQVRYVLEGSVRKAGQRIRVTAQLIDGGSGGHVWAERYDRDLADIFAVQDDVTEQIVRALEVQLTDVERGPSSRGKPEDLEAYDCVLRAREQYRLFTKAGNAAARQLYERAMAVAPNYAEGYAGAAETHVQDWISGAADGLDHAYALAQTAKRLNPSLPLVYEALSTVHQFSRQHDEALAAARRWIEVEPGDAEAYANLAGVLCFGGEPERVEGLILKAMRLNPFYPFYYPLYVGLAQFAMHRFADAVQSIKRSVARNPHALPPHFFLAAAYGQLGEGALARDALGEARRINPGLSMDQMRKLAVYRRDEDADRLLDGLRKAGLND
jgi:adenylate cyclase